MARIARPRLRHPSAFEPPLNQHLASQRRRLCGRSFQTPGQIGPELFQLELPVPPLVLTEDLGAQARSSS
jgi:hypothetical protein